MDITSVISQLIILFLMIAIGFGAAKGKVFPEGTNKILAQLVISVTNPCMVLYSVLGSQRQLSNQEVLLLTAIAIATFALLIVVGRLLPRLLRCPARDKNLYRFMCTFGNMGFIGFPVVNAIYGQSAVFYAAIFNLIFQLVLYTYGVALFSARPEEKWFSIRSLFTPMIICSVLAYIFYLTDFRTPAIVTGTLSMLSNVTSPVCMLVIGIALSHVPLHKVFTNWRLYVISIIRLVVLPLAVFFVLSPWVDNTLILGIATVMVAMPVATMTTLFAAKYGGDQQLAASGVFLSTLMSFITIPLIMWLLFS